MVVSILIAGALGLGGNSLMDIIAPIYTLLALALVGSRYIQEQNGGLQVAVDPWAVSNESAAAGSGGGGGGSKDAAPLKDLPEVGTGISIPALLQLASPGGGPALELVSVACGPRIKKVAMMNIKVYALAVYVERSERARALVKPATAGGGADKIAGALLAQDPAAFFPHALHLVFARSVSGQQVADALAEKLKAALEPAVFANFSSALLAAIGPKGLGEGETLTFLWGAPESLRIYCRGQPSAGKPASPGARAPSLFCLYLLKSLQHPRDRSRACRRLF